MKNFFEINRALVAKKKIITLLALCLTTVFAAKAEDQIYAVWDAATTTLTLRYDDQQTTNNGVTSWSVYKGDATTVVLDASMQNARPESTKFWFYQFEKLAEIRNLNYLNTSEVTNMSYMFGWCKSLTSLNLSSFNTEKVTDVKYMFFECRALKSLDLSKFKTPKVTDMSYMFDHCEALISLDLSSFNTANVEDMGNIFYACQALTSIKFGASFTTEKVTNMSYMFGWCTALPSLDLTDFNTEKVTSMKEMFTHCEALNSLDLSGFNTEKVTNMESMFAYCKALPSLDLSSFNTKEVTTMEYMFLYCKALTSIKFGASFNTAKVENMGSMFKSCELLASLDLSGFNTENVTNMSSMFYACNALTSLDLNNFNTDKVTTMSWMFNSCRDLITIYWDEDLSKISGLNSENMFGGCFSLKGDKGTKYDANHADAAYAHLDGGTSNPGYFSNKRVPRTNEMTPAAGTLYWDEAKSTWTATVYDKDSDPTLVFSISLAGKQTNIPQTIIITDNTDDENVFSNIPVSGNPDFGGVIKNAALIVSYADMPYTKDTRLFVKVKVNGEMTSDFGDKLIVNAPADFVEFEIRGITIPTSIGEVQSDQVQSTKVLRDGQILILRGDKVYTVTGQEMK